MKTLGKFLFASAGFLALVLMLALTDSGRAIAQTAAPLRVVLEGIAQIAGDVRITNAADSPVETRVNGPIQIASSPRIPVLAKASLLVSDTFQKQVTITLQPGQLNGTASFGVPASRLLKIESFSGFGTGSAAVAARSFHNDGERRSWRSLRGRINSERRLVADHVVRGHQPGLRRSGQHGGGVLSEDSSDFNDDDADVHGALHRSVALL